MTNRQREISYWIVWLGIFAGALFLRLAAIDRIPGIFADDIEIASKMRLMLQGKTSSWMTDSARPISPFYAGLALFFQSTLPPTFLVARLPAVLGGMLTLLLSFLFFRRIRGNSFAASITLFLATLPVLVSFSRFGVEQSLMALGGLLPLAFSWQGKWWLAWSGLLCAIVIHPVNAFMAPLVFVPWAHSQWRNHSLSRKQRRRRLGAVGAGCLAGAGLIFILLPNFARAWVGSGIASAADLREIPIFLFNSLNQFSGVALYDYYGLSKPVAIVTLVSLLYVALLAVGVAGGTLRLHRQGETRLVMLQIGLGLSYLLFYLLVGNRGMDPGNLRYGIFLTLPTAVMAVVGLYALAHSTASRGVVSVVILLMSLVPFLHVPGILRGLHEMPLEARTRFFKTAGREPKEQLFASLREIQRRTGQPLAVVPLNPLLANTLAYLSMDETEVLKVISPREAGILSKREYNPNTNQFEERFFVSPGQEEGMMKALHRGVIFVSYSSTGLEKFFEEWSRLTPLEKIFFPASDTKTIFVGFRSRGNYSSIS